MKVVGTQVIKDSPVESVSQVTLDVSTPELVELGQALIVLERYQKAALQGVGLHSDWHQIDYELDSRKSQVRVIIREGSIG